MGIPGFPTTTRAGRGSSTITQTFISQDEAKWVAGCFVLTTAGPPWLSSGAARESQVGTICPTMSLRSACGRGGGLCAAGFPATGQTLCYVSLCVDLQSLPTHPCLSQKGISLSSCPKRKDLSLRDFFSLNRLYTWVGLSPTFCRPHNARHRRPRQPPS